MNTPGLDVWRVTAGLFDRPNAAAKALREISIELEEGQTVCNACRLVYWLQRGACPHCEEAKGVSRERMLLGLARVNTIGEEAA